LQHILGAEHVDFPVALRIAADRDDGREMHDGLRAMRLEKVPERGIANIPGQIRDVGETFMGDDLAHIERDDLRVCIGAREFCDQRLADEARSAGDQHAAVHGILS